MEDASSFAPPPGSATGDGSGAASPPPPPPPPPTLARPDFLDDAGEQCVTTYNSGSFGQTSCTVDLQETCATSTYYAICRCPQGTCGCLRGPTTSVVTFTGCPSCPGEVATPGAPWGTGISPRDVFASCGFPN
jgi:hypothetical protein